MKEQERGHRAAQGVMVLLPLAARTGSWLSSTKGTAVAIFRSLFEMAKQAQTLKYEEKPNEKKEECLEEPE